jgi:hypothetical protein
MNAAEEIAAAAARLIVEDGLDYGAAKRKAARELGRRGEMPSNEQVEDKVRDYLSLFCADTQPAELDALRKLALVWMERLAEFRPHLAGAVWRGTATQLSAIQLELYCDDPKGAEIALINAGIDYDSASRDGAGGREPVHVLVLSARCPGLDEPATLHLALHDRDDQRGALKPDARGRSWRGDAAALRRLLAKAAA